MSLTVFFLIGIQGYAAAWKASWAVMVQKSYIYGIGLCSIGRWISNQLAFSIIQFQPWCAKYSDSNTQFDLFKITFSIMIYI